jgi:NADPH:quinone reductase-like Zn-dependent oxidoreductase
VTTTVSQKDIEYVKGLGVDEVIDYQNVKFEEKLKAYDAVFDTAGGETYRKSFQVVKEGGIIVSMVEQPNKELMMKHKVTAKAQFTQPNADQLAKLASLVDDGIIKPHIDKSFSMEQAKDAFAYQQTGSPQGKVVIAIK